MTATPPPSLDDLTHMLTFYQELLRDWTAQRERYRADFIGHPNFLNQLDKATHCLWRLAAIHKTLAQISSGTVAPAPAQSVPPAPGSGLQSQDFHSSIVNRDNRQSPQDSALSTQHLSSSPDSSLQTPDSLADLSRQFDELKSFMAELDNLPAALAGAKPKRLGPSPILNRANRQSTDSSAPTPQSLPSTQDSALSTQDSESSIGTLNRSSRQPSPQPPAANTPLATGTATATIHSPLSTIHSVPSCPACSTVPPDRLLSYFRHSTAAFHRLNKIEPTSRTLALLAGDFETYRGDYPDAITAFRAYKKKDPNYRIKRPFLIESIRPDAADLGPEFDDFSPFPNPASQRSALKTPLFPADSDLPTPDYSPPKRE